MSRPKNITTPDDGINEKDPPLCGMALISHHEVSAQRDMPLIRRYCQLNHSCAAGSNAMDLPPMQSGFNAPE
jgi:hypothetical protein